MLIRTAMGECWVVPDSEQMIVAAYRYDPFGVLLNKIGSFEQPYGFSTKRYNALVGMVQYEFRNYFPNIGRWDRRDPIGEADGLNLYAFVGNNPVNWVDPWGLETIAIITTDYIFLVPFGSHAALYISNNGNPILYDPAGSYTEGDVLTGTMADLENYVNYQLSLGSKVTRLYFDTTIEEEAAIYERIFEAPNAAPFQCAMAVSGALNGIGPFEELGMRLIPGSLYRVLRKLQ